MAKVGLYEPVSLLYNGSSMSESSKQNIFSTVAIVGGGASGTALLYTLARYTNIERIILLEKYDQVGQVNSHAKNNSQTLHVGDIETNYSIEKVRQVKPAAMMVKYYTDRLSAQTRDSVIRRTQKMILAVGEKEVTELEKRYVALKEIFPELKRLGREEIAALEPEVMVGRNPKEPVLALFNHEGYAVNFGTLAESFIQEAKKETNKRIEIHLGEAVVKIQKNKAGGYTLETNKEKIQAEVVVFDTDAYSLGFAKSLGLGEDFSLIPIAGTFYFSSERLKGKVYTMQEQRLPFAAVHGDPDVNVPDKTRWGPTARFFPVLESRNLKTMKDYFHSAGLLKWRTWKSFLIILFEPIRFVYLFKNILYELPYFGKYFFVSNIQKIIPTIRARDLKRAKGFGGMRLQRVDITKSELQLGEGKIIGENIIFNMTPSPGASVCLYNGMRDAELIMKFFGGKYTFDKEQMSRDLAHQDTPLESLDVSLKQSYSS